MFCQWCGNKQHSRNCPAQQMGLPPDSRALTAYGAGSYGAGVRTMVLDVIVRQAMAGAPWRESCQGPMLVNRISIQDVEEEVRKRGGDAGTGLLSRKPKRPPPPKNAMMKLFKPITEDSIDAGIPPQLEEGPKIMLCKECALGPESQLPYCARCGEQIHLFSDPVTDEEIETVFSNLLATKVPKNQSKRGKKQEESAPQSAHDAKALFGQIRAELHGIIKENGLSAVSRARLSKILQLMHPLGLEFRKLEALVQIADAEGRLQQDLSRELHCTTTELLKPQADENGGRA